MNPLKFVSIFFLTIVLFSHPGSISAQTPSLSANDLSQIKVDELSDEQIQSFARQAENSGMTQQQFEVIARQRGLPPSEISKLRQRMQELGSETDSRQNVDDLNTSNLDQRPPDLSMFDDLLLPDSVQKAQLKIFGMDLFKNANLSFEPSLNLATPKNYQIGPGDEVVIDVWGASEQTYQEILSPDGYIRIPNLGPLYLSGLSVEEATSRAKSRLSKIYAGLVSRDGQPPNTYVQLTLGNLRSIKVNVVGEVVNPGSYNLSSLSTIFNALYFTGGPTENGSLRKIDLYRNGVKKSTLDVYDYIVNGAQEQNIILQDQDVIIVKPYQERITIKGEVKRPGIFESIGEESLGKMIEYAGGFSENAYYSFLSLSRNTGSGKTIITVNSTDYDSFDMSSGDSFEVLPINDRYLNRVQINGAVNREGEFELTDGLTLKGLIEKADGLRGDAFAARGVLVRMNSDFTLTSQEFNASNILNGTEDDIPLQNEDLVEIKSIFDLREDFMLYIDGEVNNPGEFPFVSGLAVEDLLILAGGLKQSASQAEIEVSRRILDEQGVAVNTAEIYNFSINKDLSIGPEASSFELMPFDMVIIRKSPSYEKQLIVEVEGEVLYPGKFSLSKKNERISDVIKRAGGLTNFAYVNGATLQRRTEFFLDDEEQNDLLLKIRKAREEREYQNDTGSEIDSQNESQNQLLAAEELKINDDNIDLIREQLVQDLANSDRRFQGVELKPHESVGIDLNQILRNPGSKYDLIMNEGDRIVIPKFLQTVKMRGELQYPITVRYDKAFSFKDYVSQAGGFTETARKGRSYIVEANGSANRTRKVLFFNNYPDVTPGSEIIVPSRPQRRPLSVGEVLGLLTSLTTLIILVNSQLIQ
ncbi:MAG: SLBB domain-containing protein [Cyclobacteriaceae bacterium]